MVGVEGEGGGERSDVGDERGVLERRRRGRQEGQLAHFAVRRARRVVVGAVRAAGAARFWWIVLLRPETNHLTEKTNVLKVVYFLLFRAFVRVCHFVLQKNTNPGFCQCFHVVIQQKTANTRQQKYFLSVCVYSSNTYMYTELPAACVSVFLEPGDQLLL